MVDTTEIELKQKLNPSITYDEDTRIIKDESNYTCLDNNDETKKLLFCGEGFIKKLIFFLIKIQLDFIGECAFEDILTNGGYYNRVFYCKCYPVFNFHLRFHELG